LLVNYDALVADAADLARSGAAVEVPAYLPARDADLVAEARARMQGEIAAELRTSSGSSRETPR
jgi:hypothetical protein